MPQIRVRLTPAQKVRLHDGSSRISAEIRTSAPLSTNLSPSRRRDSIANGSGGAPGISLENERRIGIQSPREGSESSGRRNRFQRRRAAVIAVLAAVFAGLGLRVLADCASYGLPFADLGTTAFCAQIAEAYYSGLTNGTSGTTYSPTSNVPREQMAAFVTRTLDQALLRGNRRAALDQWWTSGPHYNVSLGLTSVGSGPVLLKSDGEDVWVANGTSGTVSRVHASDGRVINTWTGATSPFGVLTAMGKVFVTGATTPGILYAIDPTTNGGTVTTEVSSLGDSPLGIAFDGYRIWTANFFSSVSIITPGSPWKVKNVTSGFGTPIGLVFDGSNIWVTDSGPGTLLKLDGNGAILQTIPIGVTPQYPAFDGHNIWVPDISNDTLTVVRASDGTVLKTFSFGNGNQNGLSGPTQAAFDGQRILVTNLNGGLSLFRATDLSVIGNVATTGVTTPFGACSDGTSFWVSFQGSDVIGRF